MSPSGVLAFANLCYAVLCTFVMLDGPQPARNPIIHNHPKVDYDTICAGILIGSGIINYAIAGFGEHKTREDMVTTVCFILAGNLSFGTAYIFLKAKLIEGSRPGCTCGADEKVSFDYDVEKIGERPTGGNDGVREVKG
ncbi:hypothetical protein C0995_011682 [Termitomyces sp. Mi166|nr:hypothetical protein C0995_011682 [Termitomyces sp. Mi166\